jgi:hypothetical protein
MVFVLGVLREIDPLQYRPTNFQQLWRMLALGLTIPKQTHLKDMQGHGQSVGLRHDEKQEISQIACGELAGSPSQREDAIHLHSHQSALKASLQTFCAASVHFNDRLQRRNERGQQGMA